MDRIDAAEKASGSSTYVADVVLPNMCHAVVVRSSEPHARIVKIETAAAKSCAGVIGVFTAADVSDKPYGRQVRDAPILARDKVHFVGERVVAVVAETPAQAKVAASLVEIYYEPLDAVTTPDAALVPGAPLVHDQAWAFPNAHVVEEDSRKNLQAVVAMGTREVAEAAIARSHFVLDQTYSTVSMHQGYLETQASIAEIQDSGQVRLWCTNKSPYLLRGQIGQCLDRDPASISIQPVAIGGDFGGKGSIGDAPLCIELARLTKRPVKIVLQYSEDLTATNPRRPARIRIRLGANEQGHIEGLLVETLLNGGAFAGFSPEPNGVPSGFFNAPGYRFPVFYSEVVNCYTNTVPRGSIRAPGSPQFVFALESAIDELATLVGMAPEQFRRLNLIRVGDHPSEGHAWLEYRGSETIDAAHAAREPQQAPPGWLVDAECPYQRVQTMRSRCGSVSE